MIPKAALAAAILAGTLGLAAPLALVTRGTESCSAVQLVGEVNLEADQASNLAVILSVGDQPGIGERGKVIGVMTALTESSLRNVDHGDAAGPDSRGLFQQRADWGPVEQRMDPAGASRLFFTALMNVPGWDSMEPWDAAQAVQRSAFADGSNYRSNYDLAIRLVNASPGTSSCAGWADTNNARLPGAEAAVTRATGLVGARGYYQLCARLAANIWGRPRSGYYSAAEQWSQMLKTGNARVGDRRPPVGALLFWSTDGPYGHVAVHVGNGHIVSNDIGDSVPGEGGVYLVEVGSIEKQWNATYLGWAPPVYPGA